MQIIAKATTLHSLSCDEHSSVWLRVNAASLPVCAVSDVFEGPSSGVFSSHLTHILLKLYFTLMMRYVLPMVSWPQTASLYAQLFSQVKKVSVSVHPTESAMHHHLA